MFRSEYHKIKEKGCCDLDQVQIVEENNNINIYFQNLNNRHGMIQSGNSLALMYYTLRSVIEEMKEGETRINEEEGGAVCVPRNLSKTKWGICVHVCGSQPGPHSDTFEGRGQSSPISNFNFWYVRT